MGFSDFRENLLGKDFSRSTEDNEAGSFLDDGTVTILFIIMVK